MVTGVKKRVLIVDDEEDLTWTLSKKLSKDSDKFDLITVNSGKEAIDVLNQLPVNLVITDIRMPEVSGLELLVEIKEKYPMTKVILMTAYGSSDVQQEANERGCFKYIEKPFEINDLRELILEALSEPKGFQGKVSDFQLSDLIQLNCLGRLTSVLKVQHENETGAIYFEEGNIVHAETDTLEGENAFYYIMSWKGGNFSVQRNVKATQETIRKGWQSLLLEALRRLDESGEEMANEKEREKQNRILLIQRELERIFKLEGVERVILMNRAGFPTTFLSKQENDSDLVADLANDISNILNSLKSLQEHLREKLTGFLELHVGRHLVILRKIPAYDAYLLVVGKGQIKIGELRLALQQTARHLQNQI
ncbi:MAG: hypothetical protein Kow0037_27540 [Calditrichia bacterium]